VTRTPAAPSGAGPADDGTVLMPMDTETLRHLLDAEGIDPHAYSLDGGMPYEAYVLERRPEGWLVYYSERGLRTQEAGFESESEGCAHLLELLLRDPTTRRPA
jgi:hypothetical protein